MSEHVQLPSDAESDLVDEALCSFSIEMVVRLPSDDEEGIDLNMRKCHGGGRRRFPTYEGLPYNEVLLSIQQMVPKHDPLLWLAVPPKHLSSVQQEDVMEIFSPPRIVPVAQQHGLRASMSIDLQTGWNLQVPDDRLRLVHEVRARRPRVIIMSPPCTWFGSLVHTNWKRMQCAKRECELQKATMNVEFCMFLAEEQHRHDRGFVMEHPWASSVKKLKRVQDVARFAKFARFDQCQFGLKSKVLCTAHLKPTFFLTNIESVYSKFHGVRCQGGHDHAILEGHEGGQKRTAHAQCYPIELCTALCEALVEHLTT